MKSYMVGYDLNRPVQNYSELIEALKGYDKWWHYLDSTWIIKTDYTAEEIRNNLKQHIDSNDELLVAKLSGEAAWTGFGDKAGQWLLDNL